VLHRTPTVLMGITTSTPKIMCSTARRTRQPDGPQVFCWPVRPALTGLTEPTVLTAKRY
jgi:hypothetical protein